MKYGIIELHDLYDFKAPNACKELVMCGECKHCKRKKGTYRGEPIFYYRCAEHNRDVESDDYCSWGEREGERCLKDT